MKRILKLLARLYPNEWRRRYGAEYEALLDEGTPRVRDAVDVFWGAFMMQITSWSSLRIVLVCALVGGLAAVAISFRTPVLYTSEVVVLQFTPKIPSPAGGLAMTAESQRPHMPELAQRTFDQTLLEFIIRKYNLYPIERAKMPIADVVEKMRSAILIRPVPLSSLDKERVKVAEEMWVRDLQSLDSALTVEFEYPDAQVAQRVDAELISMLIRANLRFWGASGPSSVFSGHGAPK
jgi:hypothetical protein